MNKFLKVMFCVLNINALFNSMTINIYIYIYIYIYILLGSSGSAVGIAAGCRLDDRGVGIRVSVR
jgi:hypothetical protein